MSLLRNLAGGLRGLFRKQQVEREMDEELRGYLDAAVNEKMRRGLDREQAVRAARIEMGRGTNRRAGQGLRNIRARTASIDGGFTLTSWPGWGTELEVVLRAT